jgi:hypothetical protein
VLRTQVEAGHGGTHLGSACNSNYTRGIGRRITIQGWPQVKMRDPIPKITKREKKALDAWLKW